MSTRVGVVGAVGRMGAEVCRAVDATDDLDLVAAVSPSHAGARLHDEVSGVTADVMVAGHLDALIDAGVEVAVEFTRPDTVGANTIGLIERGIHAVVGATGMSDDEQARVDELARAGKANVLVAPNFAIGAVLMMRLAAHAAPHLPHVEIVELHHDRKADAPSGTALRTADLIAAARPDTPAPLADDAEHPGARGAERAGIRVHSVRLPGLVAHQQVIFGGTGQTLSIRHDSTDRTSFMPGVLLAVRRVAELDGLVVGLEHLL